ncbi:non-canonical purine NTP pyrophosphatase, RdgB/HAM1 family [Candidatus Collierbacteria bacterium RIFCSPLOWO2_01_FULL_50_23]|uniref:Non-canonical purine NTP pyrophosphatase, RdgB/HAM1 family n=2 Tax=Candidatus Collieribacteriota TaxID=1752725 RepID=A0A1F5ES86_9BACT|nr:MAG: non-canonical purine NTP pyrophosphatase, RdgB/HAM1 family [Candidatus Collierbacteria bacterium RIFCSPHIGHO2_02_FULL_49_10]OGD71988.1 MAG: non-canonical purine NTP pyrophosphatase, RdgB/HAM1 family [Candidatus Collierbacteria bacterium RIFCSPHIGHO2_01_FULL_50_25]OGD74907.1 MAG: non-canonical purine NTP pyrophosphatase, RdgB/HAM1 family [Candidatus Collierbacteria bacterium RIFCSPLOWO2_01_FULL_50_23]
MNFIYFATTNEGKRQEASQILGIRVEGIKLDAPEIQSLDVNEVAHFKARHYFDQLKHPLFVEDTALIFNALNGLPGPYIRDMSEALGNEGLIKLLAGFADRSARAVSVLVYIDGEGKEHIFEGVVGGTIADSVRGEGGFGWDPIFIPAGSSKTFGEMDRTEKNKISMRKLALEKMAAFLYT